MTLKLLNTFFLLFLCLYLHGANYSKNESINTRQDSLLVNIIALDICKEYDFTVEYNKADGTNTHFIRLSSDLYRSEKSTISIINRVMRKFSDINMKKAWVKAEEDEDGYYAVFFTEIEDQKYYFHISVWTNKNADHSNIVIISDKYI